MPAESAEAPRNKEILYRKELLFLVLSGVFLGTVTMMNILGVTRFLDASFTIPWTTIRIPMPLAVGVLPYPVTFLCTDLISEVFGRRRANAVVWTGLGLNIWLIFILWVGGILPSVGEEETGEVFLRVRALAFGNVVASMAAYLIAQRIDVELFHFWKRVTRGKHLWLRNNGSTLLSQLVDSIAVTLITHYLVHGLPLQENEPLASQLFTFVAAAYVFKLLSALLDTLPFYAAVQWALPRLGIYPVDEHEWSVAERER